MARDSFWVGALATALAGVVAASGTSPARSPARAASPESELRDTVELFTSDRAALLRRFAVEYSPARRERLRRFSRSGASASREWPSSR